MALLIGKKLRGFQIGVESSYGTFAPANRILKNASFKNKRSVSVNRVQEEGHRSSIGVQRGKRWSEWTMTGKLGYTNLTYIGAGLFDVVTPTNPAVGAYTYTFLENNAVHHAPQSYTFEYGNDLGSNSKFAFGVFTDMTIKVSETEISYDSSGFGSYADKNITMTATPTVIEPVIVAITDARINFATSYAGLTTGKILTAKSIELGIKSKYKSQLFIDDATVSIGGFLEKMPDCQGKIIVSEGTESDYFLGALEVSTPIFIQLKCTGPLLQTGTPNTYNSILYTWAAYLTEEQEGDTDELFTGEYTFYVKDDQVNNDINLVVTNYLSGY